MRNSRERGRRKRKRRGIMRAGDEEWRRMGKDDIATYVEEMGDRKGGRVYWERGSASMPSSARSLRRRPMTAKIATMSVQKTGKAREAEERTSRRESPRLSQLQHLRRLHRLSSLELAQNHRLVRTRLAVRWSVNGRRRGSGLVVVLRVTVDGVVSERGDARGRLGHGAEDGASGGVEGLGGVALREKRRIVSRRGRGGKKKKQKRTLMRVLAT